MSNLECDCHFCNKKSNQTKLFVKYLHYPFIVEQEIGMISNYLLPGVMDVIDNLQITYPNDYILCIGYSTQFKDFQIGLTGSVKFNEHHKTAAIRETLEEVGFISDEFKLVRQLNFGNNKKSHIYNVPAKSLWKINCVPNFKDDDNNKKVTVLIHGSLEEISRIMEESPLQFNNDEKISYFAAIKMTFAFEICCKIHNYKSKFKEGNFVVRWNCLH